MTNEGNGSKDGFKIVIRPNGPYRVFGNVPFVHKTQVVSEQGEPLTWIKDGEYSCGNMEGKDFYSLCRCGQSGNKPYCDGTHKAIGFDGTETADTRPNASSWMRFPGGTQIVVKKDPSLCMTSGFCGFADAGIYQLVRQTNDAKTRALVMAMVERCPSGALTYQIAEDEPIIEPDLPRQIAATTEITSAGPIPGPLWVTGNVTIERSDGKPFDKRNRVTLCNCGLSCQKPLCDGTHRVVEERKLRG